MKKLELRLDDLRVQTLEMGADAAGGRGTVQAHGPTNGATCPATCYTCGINPGTTDTARGANPTVVDCTLCA